MYGPGALARPTESPALTCAGHGRRLNAGPPRDKFLPAAICGCFRAWADHVPGAERPSRTREGHRAMAPDSARLDRARTAGANGSAVLVVESGPAMRKSLRGILIRSKLECIEAADGESGLRLAATHAVSAAVVSLQLPGMDGLELAWRLHSERPALCIVGLSDYAELWDADGLRSLGIRRVLSAPFSPEELLRAICPSAAPSAVQGTAQAGNGRARTVLPGMAAALPIKGGTAPLTRRTPRRCTTGAQGESGGYTSTTFLGQGCRYEGLGRKRNGVYHGAHSGDSGRGRCRGKAV